MTNQVKIGIGVAIVVASAFMWNSYQKKQGKSFLGKPLVPVLPPASEIKTSGVDGFDNTVTQTVTKGGGLPNTAERRYPPHTFIKGLGYTDSHGKII